MASVSHSIIGIIAILDLGVSILLLAGTTHPAVYILRTVPFCMTVLLYSLVARQWIQIARGTMNADPSDGNCIIGNIIFNKINFDQYLSSNDSK